MSAKAPGHVLGAGKKTNVIGSQAERGEFRELRSKCCVLVVTEAIGGFCFGFGFGDTGN